MCRRYDVLGKKKTLLSATSLLWERTFHCYFPTIEVIFIPFPKTELSFQTGTKKNSLGGDKKKVIH
jgi:hypothetical protein